MDKKAVDVTQVEQAPAEAVAKIIPPEGNPANPIEQQLQNLEQDLNRLGSHAITQLSPHIAKIRDLIT